MSDRYLSGMRESKPEVCWRIIDNGEQVCILDRGHDDGVHERDEQAAAYATGETARGRVAHYTEHDFPNQSLCGLMIVRAVTSGTAWALCERCRKVAERRG